MDKQFCEICQNHVSHFNSTLQKCYSCLRREQRFSCPESFLSDVYMWLKYKCTTNNKWNRRYYGDKICEKEEFVNYFLVDEQFLKLFKIWKDSGNNQRYRPSVYKIHRDEGCILDNLFFVTASQSASLACRGHTKSRRPIKLKHLETNKILQFRSRAECATFLKMNYSSFNNHLWKFKNGEDSTIKKRYKIVSA